MKGSVNISDYFYGAKTQFIIPTIIPSGNTDEKPLVTIVSPDRKSTRL